jgi:hypothetical protein
VGRPILNLVIIIGIGAEDFGFESTFLNWGSPQHFFLLRIPMTIHLSEGFPKTKNFDYSEYILLENPNQNSSQQNTIKNRKHVKVPLQ